MTPGIKLVWPIALVSAALGTVDSPWAPRSCSASWCRSPEEEPPKSSKWDHKMGGEVFSSHASGYYWPAESCCAPKRCPCSPGASCISRCSSQNDSWGKKSKKKRVSTLMQNFWTVLRDIEHLYNVKEWRYECIKKDGLKIKNVISLALG